MQAESLVPKYANHARAELVMELDDILRLLHTSRDACTQTPPSIDAVLDAPFKKKEKKEKDKKDKKLGFEKNISKGSSSKAKKEKKEKNEKKEKKETNNQDGR